MNKILTDDSYWSLQKVESVKWQEERYLKNGKVWGTEPGPTVAYSSNFFFGSGKRNILVIGCGYGRECMYFANNGFDVTGIDFSFEAIKMANEWNDIEGFNNLKFYQGNALQLQFKNQSFDAIFSHKVFHQFNKNDRKIMISEIYRVLGKSGVFVLSDLSITDPEFGNGELIEENTFIRPDPNKIYRPIHFVSKDNLSEFYQFNLRDVSEVSEWETHPGENTEHKHEFLRISGEKV